jgi:hypothetical protein
MANALPLPPSQDFQPRELSELRKGIEGLPRSVRERMLPLCDKICHFVHLQGKLLDMVQETVDRLSLDVKYLLFDLDATKCERDALREELENYTGGDGW